MVNLTIDGLTKNQKYYRRHKEKSQLRTQRWNDENPEKYLFKAARDRAKKKGLDFDLKLSDIVIPDVCPILNVPFEKYTDYAASVDRINPSRGYVPGNVQIISKRANLMKSNATSEELRRFAEWVSAFV